jgi:hypothetical protein
MLIVQNYCFVFLDGLKDIPKEKITKFLDDVDVKPDYENRVGEAIILLLDRYDHLEKPRLMAKLFAAYVNNEISCDEFLWLSTAVDRALIFDLRTLLDYYAGKISYDDIRKTRRNLFNSNLSDFYVLNEEQTKWSGLE